MLTFKQFNEQSPAKDYDPKDDPDSEVKDYDPRSDGEDRFKRAHTQATKKKDHPVATEFQFDGNTEKDTSKKNVRNPSSGEREPVKQGTSDLNVKHGAGRSSYRSADKQAGDKKMPKVDYESYDPSLSEAVIDDLRKIAKEGKSQEVEFKNGKSLEVDEDSAQTIVSAYDELSSARQKKLDGLLEKGPASFMKALDFANSI